MPELQQLQAAHAAAVLEFEVANRAYFALSISDRGDAFFARFHERFGDLLADQQAGFGAYYVAVADGVVLGRFNLILPGDGTATLGYRVAQRAAGQGLATACVGRVCGLAAAEHRVGRVVASVSLGNLASRRVLTKAGFARVGPADPAEVGGKPGDRYERRVTDPTQGADG